MGDILDGLAIGVAGSIVVACLAVLFSQFPMAGAVFLGFISAILIGITIWRGWLAFRWWLTTLTTSTGEGDGR